MHFNHRLFIEKFREQEVTVIFLAKISKVNRSTICRLLKNEHINIQIDCLRKLEKALLIDKGGLLL